MAEWPLSNIVETISGTVKRMRSVLVNSAGTEILTDANPGSVKLTGSTVEDDQVRSKIVSSDIAIPVDLQFHDIAAAPVAIASGTGDAQGIAAAAGLEMVGFSITEDATTSADARVRLHHGTDNTGTELFDITLSPGESVREYFAFGITVGSGVYIDRVSGTTRITLFTRVVA